MRFLSTGLLILTDCIHTRCVLYSEDGRFLRESKFSDYLWGMHYDKKMEVLYLTLPEQKEIKMVDYNNFAEIKTFHTKFPVRGITNVNGKFYTIGANLLSIFNYDFELIDEDAVDDDSDDIASDKSGNIIYSCFKTSTVTKRNKENKIMFVYKHTALKAPFGIAVDPVGNIYACGHNSNNIHVISETGRTLRILHGFTRSQFIAFQENSYKFFVVEERGIKICELF